MLHVDAPGVLQVPVLHCVQLVEPAIPLYVPAKQDEQALLLADPEYVPTPHIVHTAVPFAVTEVRPYL